MGEARADELLGVSLSIDPSDRVTRVRVVISESAVQGSLRSILEAAGFLVVGHATDAGELPRVLAATDPHVVVFDAETSALAVSSARELAPRSGIVVVWPAGVSAPVADEQVEPSRIIPDLRNAVWRAARVHLEQAEALTDETAEGAEAVAAHAGGSGVRARWASFRRADRVFVVAASAFLVFALASLLLPNGRTGFVAAPSAPSAPSAPGATAGGASPGNTTINRGGSSGQSAGTGSATSAATISTTLFGATGTTTPTIASGGGSGPVNARPTIRTTTGGGSGTTPGNNGHHGNGNSGHHNGSGRSVAHSHGGNGHHGNGNSGHHEGSGKSVAHSHGDKGHHGNGNSGHRNG